jgi:hypothetical protein
MENVSALLAPQGCICVRNDFFRKPLFSRAVSESQPAPASADQETLSSPRFDGFPAKSMNSQGK